MDSVAGKFGQLVDIGQVVVFVQGSYGQPGLIEDQSKSQHRSLYDQFDRPCVFVT